MGHGQDEAVEPSELVEFAQGHAVLMERHLGRSERVVHQGVDATGGILVSRVHHSCMGRSRSVDGRLSGAPILAARCSPVTGMSGGPI